MANYKEYQRIKHGRNYDSVGMFGDHIYVYEVLCGAVMSPEYYEITKEQFDAFPANEHDLNMNTQKMRFLCSASKGYTDF